jgi:hypothetical protein
MGAEIYCYHGRNITCIAFALQNRLDGPATGPVSERNRRRYGKFLRKVFAYAIATS